MFLHFCFLLMAAVVMTFEKESECRWVCVNKYNNIIKKSDQDNMQFDWNSRRNVITLPNSRKKGRKIDYMPEVSLRNTDVPFQKCKESPVPFINMEQTTVNCNSKVFTSKLQKTIRNVSCKPKYSIVDINYEAGSVKPPRISTKLCMGTCNSRKSCSSISSKNVSVAVSVFHHGRAPECRLITVQEDIKCKCMCNKSTADCNNQTQVLDKKFCKCKCKNQDDRRKCTLNSRRLLFYWDQETCTCKCINESVCSTGTIWNHSQCKCVF